MVENQSHIPKGWIEVTQMGKFCKVVNGLSGKTKDDFGTGKPYIPYVNVLNNSKIDITELDYVKVKEGEKQNSLQYGDLVFTTSSETIKEVGMTSVFLEKEGVYYLNSFCFILRLNSDDWLIPEFSQYLFRAESTRHSISLLGQGSTRYNLSKTRLLKELKFIIPSDTNEQAEIANNLSKVDTAIDQTEQLIAKYTRIKVGLMQDLLTKGIDENGNIRSEETHEFKDSPLGKIPKDWGFKPLGEIADFKSGYAFRYDQLTEFGIKIVRISNLHKPDFPYWHYDGPIKENWIAENGDILFTWAGVATSIDCIKYQGEKVLLNQHIYNFKFDNDLIKELTYRYLLFFLPKLRLEIEGGAGQLHLTKDKIKSIAIPDINPREMDLIIEKLMQMDSVIEDIESSLVKLQSMKTGLMQDLLSGKIRVKHNLKSTAL